MDDVRKGLAEPTGPTSSPGSEQSESWPAELHALYGTSREPFIRMASVLLGRRSEAEEVVQDAFVSASAHAHRVDNLSAYVRRSVINGAHGVLRRRQLDERHQTDPPPAEAPQQLVEFRDVLLRLPWKQRTVIVLRFLEGFSVRETAQIVDCRESTVRSHSRRGLKALRKDLSS